MDGFERPPGNQDANGLAGSFYPTGAINGPEGDHPNIDWGGLPLVKVTGKFDPTHPKHHIDVTISAVARQAGAAVITKTTNDFRIIQSVIDFDFEALKEINSASLAKFRLVATLLRGAQSPRNGLFHLTYSIKFASWTIPFLQC